MLLVVSVGPLSLEFSLVFVRYLLGAIEKHQRCLDSMEEEDEEGLDFRGMEVDSFGYLLVWCTWKKRNQHIF